LYNFKLQKGKYFITLYKMSLVSGVSNFATFVGAARAIYDISGGIGSYWNDILPTTTHQTLPFPVKSNILMSNTGMTIKAQKTPFLSTIITYSSTHNNEIDENEKLTPALLMSVIYYRPCYDIITDIPKDETGSLHVCIDKYSNLFHYCKEDIDSKNNKTFTSNPYGIDSLIFGAGGANIIVHGGCVEGALRARLLPYIIKYVGTECGAIVSLLTSLMWPKECVELRKEPNFLKWPAVVIDKINKGCYYILNLCNNVNLSLFYAKNNGKRIFKGDSFKNWLSQRAAELSMIVDNGCYDFQSDMAKNGMDTYYKNKDDNNISSEGIFFNLSFEQLKTITGTDLLVHGNECIYSSEVCPKYSIFTAVRKSMSLPFAYEVINDQNNDESISEIITGNPKPIHIDIFDHTLCNGSNCVPLLYYRHSVSIGFEMPFSTGNDYKYILSQVERSLKNEIDLFPENTPIDKCKLVDAVRRFDGTGHKDTHGINEHRHIQIQSSLNHNEYIASEKNKREASQLGYVTMIKFLASRLTKFELVQHGMPQSPYLPSMWYLNRYSYGETYLPE
jgi:predicted acylesterase/phospholipase RssA